MKLNTELGFCEGVTEEDKQLYKLKERSMNYVIILPLKEGTLNVNTLIQGQVVTHTLLVKENV